MQTNPRDTIPDRDTQPCPPPSPGYYVALYYAMTGRCRCPRCERLTDIRQHCCEECGACACGRPGCHSLRCAMNHDAWLLTVDAEVLRYARLGAMLTGAVVRGPVVAMRRVS